MDDTEDSNQAHPQPPPAVDDDESSNASVNDEVVAESEVPDEPGCAAAADDKPFVATQRGSSEDDGQVCPFKLFSNLLHTIEHNHQIWRSLVVFCNKIFNFGNHNFKCSHYFDLNFSPFLYNFRNVVFSS